MFIGHYGVGLALKRADRRLPLWLLFLSVTLVDIAHHIFILTGIETVEIVPGYTKWVSEKGINPATHSLAGIALWAGSVFIGVLLLGMAKKWSKKCDLRAAAILSLGVFSHFICDLLVHAPDIPIAGASSRVVGFGLWNYPMISNGIEIAMFALGLIIYLKTVPSPKKALSAVYAVFLVAFHLALGLFPPTQNITAAYAVMTAASILIIFMAKALERETERVGKSETNGTY